MNMTEGRLLMPSNPSHPIEPRPVRGKLVFVNNMSWHLTSSQDAPLSLSPLSLLSRMAKEALNVSILGSYSERGRAQTPQHKWLRQIWLLGTPLGRG